MEDYLLEFLMDWQAIKMYQMETNEAVTVYNTVGTIIGLLNGQLMGTGQLYDFIELLSISDEEKKQVGSVIATAYDYANKEKEKDEQEKYHEDNN